MGPKISRFLLSCVLLPASVCIAGSQPVTASDLVSWLVGGISPARLTQIVAQNGVVACNAAESRQLKDAGADASLRALPRAGFPHL